ncbi:sorting nexin-14-like [Pelmatolapia mariae]|uniref:sorting nexin-14-like n=1 Tax=Pelmatolapia mariae TaxID=158779 RepID=UPI002FE50985
MTEGPHLCGKTGFFNRTTLRSWDWSAESLSSLFTASGSSSPASCNSLHAQSTFTNFPYGSLSHHHSSPKSTSKRGESFGISRIGSKIKGVFKSTTIEGAMLPSYGLVEGEDDMVEEAMMVLEDDPPMEAASTPSTPRNLSAWNITIPYIDFYDDDVKRERIPVFCIDVERNDRKAVGHETEHWSVYRRYLEFYVLESKLTEFRDCKERTLMYTEHLKNNMQVLQHIGSKTCSSSSDTIRDCFESPLLSIWIKRNFANHCKYQVF